MNIKKIIVMCWSVLLVSLTYAVEQKIAITQINGFTQAVVAASPVQIVNGVATYSFIASNVVVSGAGNNWLNNLYTNAGNNSFVCSAIAGNGGPSFLSNCIIDHVSSTNYNYWRLRTYLTPTTNQLYTYYTNSFLIGQWTGLIPPNGTPGPAPFVSWQIVTNILASSVNVPTLQYVTSLGSTTTNGIIVDANNQYSSTIGGFSTILGLSVQEGISTVASALGSHSEGNNSVASGYYSHSEGLQTIAGGIGSHVEGFVGQVYGMNSHVSGYAPRSYYDNTWTWNGDNSYYVFNAYSDHGIGSFNINPVGGLGGFYIGSSSLDTILSSYVTNYGTATLNLSSGTTVADALAPNQPVSREQLDAIAASFSSIDIYGSTNSHPVISGANSFLTNQVSVWSTTIVISASAPVTQLIRTVYSAIPITNGIVAGNYQNRIFSSIDNNGTGTSGYLYDRLVMSDGITTNYIAAGISTPFYPTTIPGYAELTMNLLTNVPVIVTNKYLGVEQYFVKTAGSTTSSVTLYGGGEYNSHLSYPGANFTTVDNSEGNAAWSWVTVHSNDTINATNVLWITTTNTLSHTIPLQNTVYVDQSGKGQFTNITSAIKWVNTQHITNPTNWYQIIVGVGDYYEDPIVSGYTMISGDAGGWESRIFGTTSITNLPINFYNIQFRNYPADSDSVIVYSNITVGSTQISLIRNCLIQGATTSYPTMYGFKVTNCVTGCKTYLEYDYMNLINSLNSTNAKTVMFGGTNSAYSDFYVHHSQLGSSCSGNTNNNGEYITYLSGNIEFDGYLNMFQTFHDINPKLHIDGLSSALMMGNSFETTGYGTNELLVTYVTEGTAVTNIGVGRGILNSTYIRESQNSVSLLTNTTITGSLNTTGPILINGNTVLTNSFAVSTIPTTLNYSPNNIPNFSDGVYRFCNMTNNMTLYGPTNAYHGATWTCYVLSSNGSYNLSFPVQVLIPSDSGFTSPKTLTSNLTYIVQMRYGLSISGTNWLLNSVVGGY